MADKNLIKNTFLIKEVTQKKQRASVGVWAGFKDRNSKKDDIKCQTYGDI